MAATPGTRVVEFDLFIVTYGAHLLTRIGIQRIHADRIVLKT